MYSMRKWNQSSVSVSGNFHFRFLASLNLPAAIEDNGGRQVPPSVAEKSNELKRQGGITTLERMVNELPTALTRNKEILEEVQLPFCESHLYPLGFFFFFRQYEC